MSSLANGTDPLPPPPDAAQAWAIEQVLRRVYLHLDHGRYADLAALFAEDGVWHRQGRACRGRDALVAALGERPGDRLIRHLIHNLVVEGDAPEDAGPRLADGAGPAIACVRFVNVAWQATLDPAATQPPAGTMLGLWDVRGRLRCTPAGWRVLELAQQPVFLAR